MAETISIDVIFSAINRTGNVFGSINKGLNGLTSNLWKINQTAELFQRASGELERLGAPGKEYDFGLAELSAITGITGSELTDLGKMARKVGKESGLGATGALEAYKLLASQIEVDKIGMKGLNDLQAKTITLAQASPSLGLAGAADALAGTINQFGLEANQANRIMNVLAAGSKYGAAEIPDLAQSFKVVGASASAAGLSVESTAGAIEVLSKNNLKGSEAGTALRNVLLKMQTELGFDFKVTKLSDALKTLTSRQGDAAYMSKLFGMENIAAAQFLIKNADAVDEMTTKVTGTTVATEQAAIMNQTWAHKADVFKAKLNDLSIGFFQSNAGLVNMATLGGQAVMTFTALSPIFGFVGKGIMGIGSVAVGSVKGVMNVAKAGKLMSAALAAGKLGTYSQLIARYGVAGKIAAAGIWLQNAAVTAWNVISKFATGTLVPLIAQTWAWTAALMANPVTWIVAGVMALVAALLLAWKHFDGFRGGVVGAWEGLKAFGKILIDSVLNPLKQLLGGIGKVGKAIALLFKGQFSDAWKEAKDGFGDIGGAALKMNPVYQVSQVINRRDEIVNAATSGYAKGKAIDTTNFLNFGSQKQKDKGITAADLQAAAPAPFSVWKNPEVPGMQVPGMLDMSYPQMPGMQVPGMLDMSYPQMPGIQVPGMLDMSYPQMPAMQVPGMLDMSYPQMPGMQVPGMLDVQTPEMKTISLTGKVINLSVPSLSVPASVIAMSPTKAQRPSTPELINKLTPVIPFNNNQTTVDSVKQSQIVNNIERATKNITQNIANNNTTNQNDNSKSQKIEVTYSPQIHISASMTKESQDDLMKILSQNKDQLMKLIREEQRKEGRLSYAG